MSSTPETLLALRDPDADWLATLITALDEAGRDPAFQPRHAELLAQLMTRAARGEPLPAAVAEAAHARACDFGERLDAELADLGEDIPERRCGAPKGVELSVVGQ